MVLVEECTLRLDEPVDRLLPELADRRVLRRLDGPLDDTAPATRPITVRDLLTFTMGFGIILVPSGAYPIQQALNELQVVGFGPPNPSTPHDPDEWMRRLGTLPLMHQPGEQWMYNTGSYALGVLIARAADQPLETVLRERIFEPLGMKDTGFTVPAAKLDRLASCYLANPTTGVRADENYAREIMQLFTVGLWQLNADGSRQLDSGGNGIPTYVQADVTNLARVLTGWASNPQTHTGDQAWTYDLDLFHPMVAYEDHHDTNAKVIIGGVHLVPFPQSQ